MNEIEAEVTSNQKAKLTKLMSKYLADIFGDTIHYLNTVKQSHFSEKIPFEISTEQLDTIRSTTSYTYLLSVRAIKSSLSPLDESVTVDIVIVDLDTRNTIYHQSILADEFQPDNGNNGFTFWLGHSDYNLMKNALQDGMKDLKKGVKKFKKSQELND